MSARLEKIFFPLSILGLWLLFFYDALLGNTVWVSGLYVMETWMDTFPYKEFIAHSYQSGFFPLWTHNLECGYPLGSYPHSGSFYPFNFFFFLGYVRGLNLLSLFQVLLLNFFSYFCFQELGFNRLTAVVFPELCLFWLCLYFGGLSAFSFHALLDSAGILV